MVSKKRAGKKDIPVGVKIISVLYYIGAVLGVIFGLLFVAGAGILGSIANQIPLLGALGAGLFIVGGIIMIGLGILSFFVGRGLWRGQNWARIVAIVFAALLILSGIMSLGTDAGNAIVNIIINAVIGGYLLFSKKVKAAFA